MRARRGDASGTARGRIVMATVTTPSLEQAAAAYSRYLGYRVEARGTVGSTLAEAWGAPHQAGRRFLLLGPESGARTFIRLVEPASPVSPPPPLRCFGWAALELTVGDADALCERLNETEGFRLLGEPGVPTGVEMIYPLQVVGPSGEVLYLTEVRGDPPDASLPRARCLADEVFILVLGAPDREQATGFYTQGLSLDRGTTYRIAYRVLNRAFGLPEDAIQTLTMVRSGPRPLVEVDQAPDGASWPQRPEGSLPAGISGVTLGVTSLEQVSVPLSAPPRRRPEPPYLGRRMAVCTGTAGELIEVVEVAGDDGLETRAAGAG